MCVNARARVEEAGLTSSVATCARPMQAKRDLCRRQKRPIYKAKETYVYGRQKKRMSTKANGYVSKVKQKKCFV